MWITIKSQNLQLRRPCSGALSKTKIAFCMYFGSFEMFRTEMALKHVVNSNFNVKYMSFIVIETTFTQLNISWDFFISTCSNVMWLKKTYTHWITLLKRTPLQKFFVFIWEKKKRIKSNNNGQFVVCRAIKRSVKRVNWNSIFFIHFLHILMANRK